LFDNDKAQRRGGKFPHAPGRITKSFDELARFGYSIFGELVGEAVKHKLPMKSGY
jgi:hypothetical protein